MLKPFLLSLTFVLAGFVSLQAAERAGQVHEIDSVAGNLLVLSNGRVVTLDDRTLVLVATDTGERAAERADLRAGQSVRIVFGTRDGMGVVRSVTILASKEK